MIARCWMLWERCRTWVLPWQSVRAQYVCRSWDPYRDVFQETEQLEKRQQVGGLAMCLDSGRSLSSNAGQDRHVSYISYYLKILDIPRYS